MPEMQRAREGELLLLARLLQTELGKIVWLSYPTPRPLIHISQAAHKAEHKPAPSKGMKILSNLFPTPKIVSEPDPATGAYNPFPAFAYTGPLRPVYPLSPRREVPNRISNPDYAKDGIPRSEQVLVGRNKIAILNDQEQEGMRKVCRLAREVLDIAARASVPGVTTDYIDEVVHKACLERDVRLSVTYPAQYALTDSP